MGVTVAVVRTDPDQRQRRAHGGDEPVGVRVTAVVGHLQDIGGDRGARSHERALGLHLGVARQQERAGSGVDAHDDRGLVEVVVERAVTRRPEHVDAGRSQGEPIAGGDRDDRHAAPSCGGTQSKHRGRATIRLDLVGADHDRPDAQGSDDGRKATAVVVVGVAECDDVEVVDAARPQGVEDVALARATVDQHAGGAAVGGRHLDQQRIALTDVQRGDRQVRRPARRQRARQASTGGDADDDRHGDRTAQLAGAGATAVQRPARAATQRCGSECPGCRPSQVGHLDAAHPRAGDRGPLHDGQRRTGQVSDDPGSAGSPAGHGRAGKPQHLGDRRGQRRDQVGRKRPDRKPAVQGDQDGRRTDLRAAADGDAEGDRPRSGDPARQPRRDDQDTRGGRHRQHEAQVPRQPGIGQHQHDDGDGQQPRGVTESAQHAAGHHQHRDDRGAQHGRLGPRAQHEPPQRDQHDRSPGPRRDPDGQGDPDHHGQHQPGVAPRHHDEVCEPRTPQRLHQLRVLAADVARHQPGQQGAPASAQRVVRHRADVIAQLAGPGDRAVARRDLVEGTHRVQRHDRAETAEVPIEAIGAQRRGGRPQCHPGAHRRCVDGRLVQAHGGSLAHRVALQVPDRPDGP